MPAIIPVTGYASDYRVPSIGMELAFAQGDSISGSGAREILIITPILATGTYVAGTVYGPIKSEAEVAAGVGPGGRGHRIFRKIAKANKGATVYILAVAETSGGTPVQAIGNMVLSGTATSDKVWSFTICEEEIQVFIRTGDAAADIATRIRAIINAKTWLPVTAAGSAGTVAITYKHFGTCGGDGTYNPIRVRGVSPANGITATIADVGATTAGAEGSTSEAAALTTALASVEGRYFYYYAYDNFGNATAMAALRAHIANKNLPRNGRFAYLVSGYNGTGSAFTTLANAHNYECFECALQPYGYHDPATLCGQLVASLQKVRETDPANGMINYAGPEWDLMPAPTQYWLDEDDINDLMAAGASVIASRPGGTYLVQSLTTRSKDSSGTYADFRAAESHRVSVAHFCAVDLRAAIQPMLGQGFKAHPKLPSGDPDPNARIARNVVTDFQIKPTFVKKIIDWENAGLTQRSADSLASLTVVKSPINAGRLESGFSLYARDNLSQITCRIAEASAA